MAVTRSLASAAKNGRVGDTTYYTSQGRQISRAAVNVSNFGASASRTTAQQTRRVKWANLVNFYKVSKSWMYYAFETKKAGVSDYNKFMSINVNGSSIALTKTQAASGGCVAEGYHVTEGSLMPIEANKMGNVWVTNIACTLDAITATTTVAEFTANVIAANSWLLENMQISFISYQQTLDTLGVPRLICTPYEMTLSTSNNKTLRSYLPEFCSHISDGYLATSDGISPGAFTYVLSQTLNGKTYVSTQLLVNNNSTLIAQFSSSAQLSAAIDSYGVDGTKFLQSGSNQTAATAQPDGILTLVNNDQVNLLSSEWSIALDSDDAFQIYATTSMDVESVDIQNVYLTSTNGGTVKATAINRIYLNKNGAAFDCAYAVSGQTSGTVYLVKFDLIINGVTYAITGGYGKAEGE